MLIREASLRIPMLGRNCVGQILISFKSTSIGYAQVEYDVVQYSTQLPTHTHTPYRIVDIYTAPRLCMQFPPSNILYLFNTLHTYKFKYVLFILIWTEERVQCEFMWMNDAYTYMWRCMCRVYMSTKCFHLEFCLHISHFHICVCAGLPTGRGERCENSCI